jgi:UV DNA damage endonuclease
MIRHLGYACQNLSLCEGRKPKDRYFTDRTLRMDRFSLERVGELGARNAADLLPILQWNVANGIKFFRIGSGMFPFMDHPTLGYSLSAIEAFGIRGLSLKHSESITNSLAAAGEYAKKHGIRLSCHPGPYTCIASPDRDVVDKSILSLHMHSLIGDLLCYGDEFAINIHVGGVYGNKKDTAKRFADEFNGLPENIQNRITVENDDKPSMWSMSDLYEILWARCQQHTRGHPLKLVLDVHHHRFCHRESLLEAADMAFRTWQGFCEVPKVHYSESKAGARPQAHSDYIREEIPLLSDTVEYDVMIEAKAKDLALLEYRKVHAPCLV